MKPRSHVVVARKVAPMKKSDYAPLHYQELSWSCGAAVVRNALRLMGKDVKEGRIRKLAGTSGRRGTTITGIVEALRAFGYNGHRMTLRHRPFASLSAWLALGRPVIISCNRGQHWALALASFGDGPVFLVHDPDSWSRDSLQGFVVLNKKQMSKYWRDNRGLRYAIVVA